ncbi:MAG: S41 family peptidase [Turicibacter sp.]|nr:S41 family peptidase [Turicibacter sp.]
MACGNDNEQYQNEEYIESKNQIVENVEERAEDPYVEEIINNLANRNQLAYYDFLYDLEFLVRMLEENFPFIGLAERRLGGRTPLELLMPDTSENLTHTGFMSRIRYTFRHGFMYIAHLDLNPPGHWRQRNSNPLHTSDSTSSILASTRAINRPIQTSSRIIEKNRIALIMTPPEFFNNSTAPPRAMREMQDFIGEIQGYEHVIIDLRHIGGGWSTNFINTFISPNIPETLSFYEFAFIMNGEIARRTHSNFRFAIPNALDLLVIRSVVNAPLVQAELFVEQHNLINMNADDLENLAYGFLLETFIQPVSGSLRLPLLADNIWLLIGPGNWSAAEFAGRLAKEAGFTLVGQQASGRIGRAGRHFFFIT